MVMDRLKAVVKRIEQLPPEERERLLEQIEDALDNAQWHALLADPRSGPALDALIARAKQSPKRPWPPHEDQVTKSGEASKT